MVGGGLMILATIITGQDHAAIGFAVRVMIIGGLGHLVISLVDLLGRHPTRNAAVGAHIMVKGRYARLFWLGSMALCAVAVLIALPSWNGGLPALAIIAGLIVQAALLIHESVYLRAAQDVPLS